VLAYLRLAFFSGLFVLATAFSVSGGETAAPIPNTDPTYQQLRNITLGGEAVNVSNFKLKRDAGTFHLRSGTVCFVVPVNGKVTGAVFAGDGNFVLDAPEASERASLKLLTKEDEFSEDFNQAVFRFTDSTYDDIKKGGSSALGGCDAGLLRDVQNITRHKLKTNVEARILEDVLSPEPGGLFLAFIHGTRYSDKELFEIDPDYGAGQVNFWTYDENKWGYWASFNLSGDHAPYSVGKWMGIEHQTLDVTFEKSGNLVGKATTDFVARRNGLRVVSFDLFRTLRVESVSANGKPLSFIQEDKNDDADFAVILPQALATGEKFTITTTYEGKEAVRNEGGGNYFPVARQNWYPNSPIRTFRRVCTLRHDAAYSQGNEDGRHRHPGFREQRERSKRNRVEKRGSADGGGVQLWQIQGGGRQARETGVLHPVLCERRVARLGAGCAASSGGKQSAYTRFTHGRGDTGQHEHNRSE
jgi:hypothetical protein